MSKSKKAPSIPRHSDILIAPDGSISLSFLWDELRDLVPEQAPTIAYTFGPEKTGLSAAVGDKTNTESTLSYEHCTLCPKMCGFPRTRLPHPRCGDAALRIATYGLSFGDEFVLAGNGGSGVVMLSGCPLHCASCHNPEMVASGTAVSVDEAAALAWELQQKGAENLQVLSPTVHIPMLQLLFAQLKREGYPIPIAVKSSGYESIPALKTLAGLVDMYIPDLKYGSCSKLASQAGASNYFAFAKAAIAEMYRQVGPLQCSLDGVAQKGLLIRHIRAPIGDAERRDIDDFLASLPTGIGLSLDNAFTDFGDVQTE